MPTTQPSIDARAALRAAAKTTAARLVPGHGAPEARHLALLAEVEPPPVPRVWTDDNAATLAAIVAARARRDALTAGSVLVARYFDGVHLIRPATLSPGARSQLYSSVSEYCSLIGKPQIGAHFGAEALLFADTAALRYRALSVSAASHALNGEYLIAEDEATAAHALFAEHGWDPREKAQMLLTADALIAESRMDHARLDAIADEMTAAQRDDPYVDYWAQTFRVLSHLLRRDHAEATAASWQIMHSSRRQHSQRLARDFLTGVRSDVLLAQSDYAGAMAVVAQTSNPEGHGVCFSTNRASCLLLLGRERELIAETEACVAPGTDHCLRTLTPILLRRAIAFHRLGSVARARQSMESALLLIKRNGKSATPFVMLPGAEALHLMEMCVADQPGLGVNLPCIRDILALVGAPSTPPAREGLVAFTPAERALVELLETPLSLAEIARRRGVSPNTVKSQVRSIYAKLDVGGRAAAVSKLALNAG